MPRNHGPCVLRLFVERDLHEVQNYLTVTAAQRRFDCPADWWTRFPVNRNHPFAEWYCHLTDPLDPVQRVVFIAEVNRWARR